MTNLMSLDLVDKGLVTDQIVLTLGYDIENLTNPEISSYYKGEVTIDRYGRKTPKHAHGTINLEKHTSSSRLIVKTAMELYERIADKNLIVRRVTVVANPVIDEKAAQNENTFEQLDLFTDYSKREEEKTKTEQEKNMQQAILKMKKKYGKNTVLRGINLQKGATTVSRNNQIGGHKA